MIRTTLLLGFIAISMPSFAQLKATSYASSQNSKTAKFIYVYDGIPGFIQKNNQGVEEGLLVDIMKGFERYVSDQKGIDVSVEYYQVPDKDFKILMRQVKDGSGGVFGLSNVSIKEERKENYRFSPPYMNNVSVLISNAKTPTLPNLEEMGSYFGGKKAYSVAASTYYERLDELRTNYYPSMEIVNLVSVQEVLNEIATNNEAIAVIDLLYYLNSLKDYPIKRHAVGDKGEDKYGIIMPLSNDWEPLLTAYFNSGFIGGSEYRRLIGQYLGKGALRLIEGVE